jgi:hypothetical protein
MRLPISTDASALTKLKMMQQQQYFHPAKPRLALSLLVFKPNSVRV